MTKQVAIGLLLLFAGVLVTLFPTGLPSLQAVADQSGGQGWYCITARFDWERLNSRMLVSHTFRLKPTDSLAQVLPTIRHQFHANADPNVVAMGNAAHVPVGWAYVALVNTTNQTQPLVLAMPQERCYLATLFVGRANRFDSVGTVQRVTPLGNRFFPSLNLAFPISLPPRTTLPILLRTENYVGFHEVDIRLYTKRTYYAKAFIDSIRDGAQVIVCLLLAVIALLIGWRVDNRLMRTFGGYMLSLSGAFSCLFGYLFFLPFSNATSVNAATLGTLFRLIIAITVHPFLYELIKPAIRNHRQYKRRVTGFCMVVGVFVVMHLMPYRYYSHVNYTTNLAMTILDIVNVGWVCCYSVIAWRRAGIWSTLLICLLLFIPLLLNQFLLLIQAPGGQDSFRTPATHPMLLIALLSYLTFEQFQKELVTRQRLQDHVREVQQDLHALRRREIEGIGRDLHDQVGNTLATALGYLDRLPTDTQKPRDIIISAIGELRFLSHNLVKDDDRPLTEKVATLVGRFNDFAVVQIVFADYTHQQIDQLSALKQQNLYSILQELLTNIIRHAQATQATVQFFCDETTVDVSVEDDGIGFVLPPGKTTGGIGIENIHKRATLSNIRVRFDPAPTGTTVLLTTPPPRCQPERFSLTTTASSTMASAWYCANRPILPSSSRSTIVG